MKKISLKIISEIEWGSKFIDLLIVIIGITIAFQLNSWNEKNKSQKEANDYINSFVIENNSNERSLMEALDYSLQVKRDIDSLKEMLLTDSQDENKIKTLSVSMIGFATFNPSTTTMENIKASGEFELIKNIELREQIISTYNKYKTTLEYQRILLEFYDSYGTPFFFKNMRFSSLEPINPNFTKDPFFENIVFGYSVLLDQQINGYHANLELVKSLGDRLDAANTR